MSEATFQAKVHELAGAAEKARRVLYGMLCHRWGHPRDWPENGAGFHTYKNLKAAIEEMEKELTG